MLETRILGLIESMFNHCRRIEEKVKNISEDEFLYNEDIFDIVSLHLSQIGELAKKLDPKIEQEYDVIPWKQIKGMRDHIVHGYDCSDRTIIYQTAKQDIPPLKDLCESILDENI